MFAARNIIFRKISRSALVTSLKNLILILEIADCDILYPSMFVSCKTKWSSLSLASKKK